MSSILDALNKLEQEKAQAKREAVRPEDIDPANAARDLVGPDVLRDRVTLRIPGMLIVAGAVAVTALVLISVAMAVIFLQSAQSGPGDSATIAAATTPLSEPSERPKPPIPESSASASHGPLESSPPVKSPERGPIAATSSSDLQPSEPAPESTPASEPDSSAAPTVRNTDASEREPEADGMRTALALTESVPVSVERDAPAPGESVRDDLEAFAPDETFGRPAPEPAPHREARDRPATRQTPGLEDEPASGPDEPPLIRYPILTTYTLQSQYGFERVSVNMVKPAGPTNPRGSALITVQETDPDGGVRTNRVRFYEGERIQRSQLRLFKVEQRAVGFEDLRTGDRYHIPF